MAESNVVPIKPNSKIKAGAEYVSGSPYGTAMPRVLSQFDETGFRTGIGYISHQIIEEMLTDPDVFAGIALLTYMATTEKLIITPAITETTEDLHKKEQAAEAGTESATGTPAPATDNTDATDQQNKDNVPAAGAAGAAGQPTAPAPETQPVDPRVARAKEIADFCQRQYDRVPKLSAVIFQMIFEGLAHGNKVAEQVLEVAQRGQDAGRWCLKSVKPKPRETIAFVMDAYMNELGMLGARPGESAVISTTMVPDMSQVIPREKFWVFTHRPKDGDPRGTTALLAALNGWDMKRRTFPEYLLFLMVSAIPGILATVAPNQDEVTLYEDDGITPRLNPDTGEPLTIQAHQFLLNMLGKMRNHQVGVAPEGTEFTLLEANSEGETFTRAIGEFGSQITMAILNQQLMTRDAKHQTKGSTGEQAKVVDYIVWFIRDNAADMVRYDCFKPLVRYNFGDDDADELLPKCSYGDTEARDWSTDAAAVAQLIPLSTESQADFLMTQIGVPLPTDAERAFKRAAKSLMQQGQAQALNDNASGNSDDNATAKDKGKSSDKSQPAAAGK